MYLSCFSFLPTFLYQHHQDQFGLVWSGSGLSHSGLFCPSTAVLCLELTAWTALWLLWSQQTPPLQQPVKDKTETEAQRSQKDLINNNMWVK